MKKNNFVGTCHCGKNTFVLHSEKNPEEFIPRCDAKTCSFCQKNNGVWISDSSGILDVSGAKNTKKYSFASKIVDFHFCETCGTLCFAVFEKKFAVARVACFDKIFSVCQAVQESNFENETSEEGVLRRRKNWTPITE